MTTTIPAGASRTFTAAALESGDEGLEGALGDGKGKWRLEIASEEPIIAMSLLSNPMGNLTNLSTAPGRELQGPADLVVVSPSVSNSRPVAGATFTLSATVQNDGGTPSPVTVLRYYRSADATITATDRAVDTDAVAGLAASGSASASVELSAPSTPGTYYFGACVDAVAEEFDTTNNCSTAIEINVRESESEPRGQPDLMVASPKVSDDVPAAGATFILSVTVNNAGDGAAPSAMMRYYRSSDATITTSDTPADTEVGTDEVAGLAATASDSESVDLSAPSEAGAYYYGACVDSVADESDTTNNCSSSVTIAVEEGSSGQPDLRIVGVVAGTSPYGVSPGRLIQFSATVRNVGDANSDATTLRYYRSTDATISTSDTEVGTGEVSALVPSMQVSEQIDLNAPSTAGTYYYGTCVDAVAEESDTTNNCSGSIKVDVAEPPTQPRTTVEITAPQKWAPVGGTVTYTATVLNGEGEEIDGASIAWSSSNTGVATVDTNGVVIAVAEGEATVTATATVPSTTSSNAAGAGRAFGSSALKSTETVSGSAKMNVVKAVARLELSPSSLSFDEVGAWVTLTATLYDANGSEMRPTYWGWFSTDREVAQVSHRSGSGTRVEASLQSIGEGTTTVGLSANGTTESISVTVTLPAARVDLSPRSLTFEALGDTKSVTVRVLDENGDEDENATLSYLGTFGPCCNPDIADPPKAWDIEIVDGGLEITAEGPGSGKITISSTDVESAILPVNIYMKPATLEVSPSSTSLAVGETATLSATIRDANGHSIHVNQDDGRGGLVVYWETSDDQVATVEGETATTDYNTGGPATVTAVAAGTATITGRWGSSVRGTSTVTVTDSN